MLSPSTVLVDNISCHFVARLEATQARERERELLATFEPIERLSEAGDNDYDIAPTRRVLGLELLPSDPDLVKILKNHTWNYLRVSERLRSTM